MRLCLKDPLTEGYVILSYLIVSLTRMTHLIYACSVTTHLRLACWYVCRVSLSPPLLLLLQGRDWSGRMVNISTQNVLAEKNSFLKGHGVSIGSETSGWVRTQLSRTESAQTRQHVCTWM